MTRLQNLQHRYNHQRHANAAKRTVLTKNEKEEYFPYRSWLACHNKRNVALVPSDFIDRIDRLKKVVPKISEGTVHKCLLAHDDIRYICDALQSWAHVSRKESERVRYFLKGLHEEYHLTKGLYKIPERKVYPEFNSAEKHWTHNVKIADQHGKKNTSVDEFTKRIEWIPERFVTKIVESEVGEVRRRWVSDKTKELLDVKTDMNKLYDELEELVDAGLFGVKRVLRARDRTESGKTVNDLYTVLPSGGIRLSSKSVFLDMQKSRIDAVSGLNKEVPVEELAEELVHADTDIDEMYDYLETMINAGKSVKVRKVLDRVMAWCARSGGFSGRLYIPAGGSSKEIRLVAKGRFLDLQESMERQPCVEQSSKIFTRAKEQAKKNSKALRQLVKGARVGHSIPPKPPKNTRPAEERFRVHSPHVSKLLTYNELLAVQNRDKLRALQASYTETAPKRARRAQAKKSSKKAKALAAIASIVENSSVEKASPNKAETSKQGAKRGKAKKISKKEKALAALKGKKTPEKAKSLSPAPYSPKSPSYEEYKKAQNKPYSPKSPNYGEYTKAKAKGKKRAADSNNDIPPEEEWENVHNDNGSNHGSYRSTGQKKSKRWANYSNNNDN
jgi:hypothetical protein